MSDERITMLIELLRAGDQGFANDVIWRHELLAALEELQRCRRTQRVRVVQS